MYSQYAKRRQDVGKVTVIGFLGVLALFAGAYLAWTMMAAEVLFMAAKDRDMPSFLGRTSSKNYTCHPDFAGAQVWWGDPEKDWGLATLEGGDVMPVGNGVVLIGMSERSSRQAITQVAAAR